MVKKIIKIVSIVLASCALVIGGVIGVVALRGGFEEEVINITKLYFGEDDTAVTKEYRTLDDVIANINFEPKNATNKELEVEILGNDNGVISAPKKITAGEDFTLDVKQDSKGNNIGGVVTIKAKQGIAEVTMTVIVDVDIPDNALYFTGDDTGKITTSGKSFTMAISDNTQYVYLKSNLVNAFFLQANNENLKNTDISYTYSKEDGTIEDKNVSSVASIERKYNAHDNMYNYYYKIPLVTDQAGTIDITAKMHRTSEIERIFKESNFANLPKLLKNQNNSHADREAATLMLSKYNDFLNRYIQYFDTSVESYSFFKNSILSDGRITLSNLSQVNESLNYVFVSATARINVTAIKLESFTSMTNPREYGVTLTPGSEELFSVSGLNAKNIVDEFALSIKTDNDTAIGSDEKKDYMFKSLAVKPYLYLDVEAVPTEDLNEGEGKITWYDRDYKYTTVYYFEGNTPVTKPTEDLSIVGYLLLLESADEYISITQLQLNEEKHWKLSCNVPMVKDQAETISKALYLGFEVSGIGSTSNAMITIETYTRLYVNYEELEFTYEDVNNIAINSLDTYMSINTSDIQINETSEFYGKLTTGRYVQDITDNITAANIDNLDTATYQNVMYFAESTSNRIDGEYPKVATVGKYRFINYASANAGATAGYMYGEEELVGERIATYKMVNNEKRYYLHAINAATTPVRLFAVVYLSDKNGKPIDINGRTIDIDESEPNENPYTIVTLRISEITDTGMPSVFIQSYVENINFYTKSNVVANFETVIDDATTEKVTLEQGFTCRNHLNFYTDENGNRLSDETLDKLHDYLSLKLLKNNYFTIYITNFDLAANDGSVVLAENTLTEIACYDLFGRPLDMGYTVYNHSNKQIAFNALCNDLSNYSLYTDSQQVEVFGNPEVMSVDGEWDPSAGINATMIRFVLHSSKEDNANTDPKIYLNPENSSIPYSKNLIFSESDGEQQIQRTNYVVYNTNKLEIEDVQLAGSITLQNKLYARYAKMVEGVNPGDLTFNYDVGGGASGGYTLPIVNGNVAYTVKNNLISDSKTNYDVVDCSQAGTIDRPSGMEGVYFYDTIENYIAYYTSQPNATAITYTTGESVVALAEDMHFNNILQEKSTSNINFGTKQFSFVENGVIGTVDINGFVLNINLIDQDSKEWDLTIPKGTIFPLVDGNKALIYNEVFELTSSDYTNYYIKDYVNQELGISGKSIKVNKSADILLSNGQTVRYDASKYLDDEISAIVKGSSQGDSVATLNFLQGEELGRFIEDANGNYKKIVDKTNPNAYTYQLLDGTESADITRYSVTNVDANNKKMGVKVYMVITIPFIYNDVKDSYEYTFYKAIEYELLQEEIKVIGYNSTTATDINTNINPCEVDAGKSTSINLGTISNSGPYILIQATGEQYFFEHVDFKITSTSIVGVTCAVAADHKSISVTVPDLTSNDTFVIQMQYLYKNNQTVTVNYYVEAVANIEFVYDKSKVTITDISSSEKAYAIKLAAGEYDIEDIFSERFEYNTDTVIDKVILKENSTEYTNTITLPNVNAEYDGTTINYGSKIYTILLKLQSGKVLELNYKLYIEIIPTYLIDATAVENNAEITIYNGEDLFANYIKLFNGNSSVSSLTDSANVLPATNAGYGSIYTLSVDAVSLDKINSTAFAKGQIKLDKVPATDTEIDVTVKYTTYNGTETSHTFKVIVRGVTMKYSLRGTVDGGGNDVHTLNSDITLEVPESTISIDVSKYFDFELSNANSTDAVMAVLIDSTGKTVSAITELNHGDEYEIAYMKSVTGSGFVLVGSTGYKLTLSVVTG